MNDLNKTLTGTKRVFGSEPVHINIAIVITIALQNTDKKIIRFIAHF